MLKCERAVVVGFVHPDLAKATGVWICKGNFSSVWCMDAVRDLGLLLARIVAILWCRGRR